MTTTAPRRRVLRPRTAPAPDPRQTGRIQRWQVQLARDRESLKRWMSRLKRAFNTVERLQSSIARIERRIGQAS